MKTDPPTPPNILRLTRSGILALTVALPISTGGAQDSFDQQGEAYRASMAQDDVRRDAKAIQNSLIELREQMRQLMPDDVAMVDAAIQKMQSLSQDEMDSAVTALQEASRSKDAGQQVEKIAGALKNQGVVSTALKKLSVDLQAKEDIASLAADLNELVRREVSVSLEINRLGKIQQVPGELRNRHQERYQVANEDQKGITADLKLFSRKVDNMSKDFAADPNHPVVQATAVGLAEELSENADKAQALTESGPFSDAVLVQTQIIKTLVAMEKALATGGDPLDRLRALLTRLQQTATDQKEIVDAVMLIGERQDLSRNEKRLQERLGDEVVAVRFELETSNNLATNQLLSAQEAIDKSLANYIRMWEEHMDARVNTQEAHKNIVLAIQTLEKQIVAAEKNAPKTPAQLAAQLDQLQREVALAAVQQAQATRLPQTPAQRQIQQDRVNDFQQRAAQIAPAASELLAEAANQLPTNTPEAQMAAARNLAAASQELLKQKTELAALAQIQNQLATAEQLIEKADENLAKDQTPPAANDLKAAQQATEAAQQASQQTNPAVAEALAEANQALQQAAQAAAQTKADAAQEQTQTAANALAEAGNALQQAMAQKPGMSQMAMMMGAGTEVSENAEGEGKNPRSQGNGSGGPTGDNLAGAGDTRGNASVLEGLTPKDREAVAQLQNEKPPREFVLEVQQYYKNIADGVGLQP